MQTEIRSIGVLGGTGALGGGLAYRLAKAGYKVILGSRSAEKASASAQALFSEIGSGDIVGATNKEMARVSDVVIVAVPFVGRDDLLSDVKDALAGKIVIDATVPLAPPKVATVHLRPLGSGAVELQALLGVEALVVSAFQNIAAAKLRKADSVQCDVLVCSDHKEAKASVIALAETIGLRALDAGPLVNSVVAESLTSILIGLNKRYKAEGAGICITGLPAASNSQVTAAT